MRDGGISHDLLNIDYSIEFDLLNQANLSWAWAQFISPHFTHFHSSIICESISQNVWHSNLSQTPSLASWIHSLLANN